MNDGRTLAARLLATGSLTLLLDGLDELPEQSHAQAVKELDRLAASGRSLVVTCRSGEYQHVVQKGGAVMSRAAVVEIEPIDTEQVVEFLGHPAPFRDRWKVVFRHLHKNRRGPLALSLSTPLMVALAKTVYSEPSTDPARLLELPDREAIERALFERFIDDAYWAESTKKPTQHGRKSPSYPSTKATSWLTYIAYHLYLAGTTEYYWWQLKPNALSPSPQRTRILVSIVGALVPAALLTAVVGTLKNPLSGVVTAIFVVALAAISSRFGPVWSDARHRASHAGLTKTQSYLGRVALSMGYGGVCGIITGTLTNMPILGGTLGSVCGLIAFLLPHWTPRLRPRESTPKVTLHTLNRNAGGAAARTGITGAAVFGATAFGTEIPLSLTVIGLATAVFTLAGAYDGGMNVWFRYRVSHVYLALCGHLPWRIWRFLFNAHQRGVLRQAGTAWQFRHALLQDHLVDAVREDIVRARVKAGDRHASIELADLLARDGRLDESRMVLQPFADAGDWAARRRVAELLVIKITVGRTRKYVAIVLRFDRSSRGASTYPRVAGSGISCGIQPRICQ